ncbi:right-handed parallel beta-helix repeat-containing protein [Verrucomicrobiota bacterium]
MAKWLHIIVLLLIARMCQGATYEVGSGQAYASIQDALDQVFVVNGSSDFTETETINVRAGTYAEQIQPNTNLSPTAAYGLVIKANSNDTVVVGTASYNYGFYIPKYVDYVTIKGFEITGCTNGIYFYSNYVTVESNEIHDIVGTAIYHGIGNGGGGQYGTVRYNVVYNNGGYGIFVYGYLNVGSQVINNTCHNNQTGIRNGNTAVVVIKNNISANNTYQDYSISVCIRSNNCSTDATAVGSNSLANTDPYFVDIGTNVDFTLLSNSPCINAGEGGVNMGAYPSQSSYPYSHTKTNHTVKLAGGGDWTVITNAFTNTGPQRVMGHETIDIYDGTYEGQVTITDRGHITLRAADGQSPVIDATNETYGVYIDSSAGVTISGFEITGASSYGVRARANYATVELNEIYGNGSAGIYIEIGNGGFGQDAMIRYNVAYNNSGWGIHVYGYNNGSSRVLNNTCYNNTFGGICNGINSLKCVIKNNISANNGGLDYQMASGSNTYNCSTDESADDRPPGTGCLTNTNPVFVDTASNDFHVKSGEGTWNGSRWTRYPSEHSPCIDAGDPDDSVGAEPAPNGGRINMGAYGETAEASKSLVPGAVLTIW